MDRPHFYCGSKYAIGDPTGSRTPLQPPPPSRTSVYFIPYHGSRESCRLRSNRKGNGRDTCSGSARGLPAIVVGRPETINGFTRTATMLCVTALMRAGRASGLFPPRFRLVPGIDLTRAKHIAERPLTFYLYHYITAFDNN